MTEFFMEGVCFSKVCEDNDKVKHPNHISHRLQSSTMLEGFVDISPVISLKWGIICDIPVWHGRCIIRFWN